MRTATKRWIVCLILALGSFTICTQVYSQSKKDKITSALPDSWSEKINWRSIGPANMSGRISAIAVYEKDPCIWWAASASGGLLKTVNNGIKFEHQFDDQATVSIGDVQVSKTDPDLVWVGTGEANPRNSVSWGDGVYKSTDGGKTWKNMGLKKSFQIGRIAIHPEDHNIVYVGALGRLWGPNEERGLFKTTDGGETWNRVLYVDDKTGVIDVQMNPKNPDELLVATYERMRDSTDDNDPIAKYGDGSAVYKTIDGGETFQRMSQGLPSCKLGRIGLCYFLKNPDYVAAIIESEKIAKEPENAGFAGLRGQDADVGAKITQVTDEGPAGKAGLKENDIVISVDGDIVYSYRDLLGGIRKHQAGETVKLVVSRDRKPVDVAIELGKKPVRKGRDGKPRQGRSPFTGTLGGQAANLQGQQGVQEQEYGGVYLSKDGGDSWERINTLNPRPMYYSQIRIDPTDRKRMYVLGTSLYRSSDGGKTFTSDGGRGVHVDHHALWIDPDDSRHMILGNDGGIHVTFDRMDSWDTQSHVAIGQFYHAGTGSRLNYRVYGGLQDNGSWGGPSRVANDSGSVNSDWFRVGGGDGFVTLVDPEDPDQIYFESQNGAMGRINLRTGERGFIRPRPPKGTKYRFNWKTPFILSPHNSRIHYSAGNYVFKSVNKGNGIKAISPEITNTDKGAGSAITESPVQAGVVYVGTTDGALWMTKNGGNEWVALYSAKETKEDSATESKSQNKEGGEQDSAADSDPDSPATESERKSTKKDVAEVNINGVWNGQMISDRFPEDQAPTITFTLKSDDKGNVSGEIETRRGPQEITEGKFDRESGELSIVIETQRGRREFEATVKGKKMTGEMSMRDGQFTVEFEAEKQADPDKDKLLWAMQYAGSHKILAAVLNVDNISNDDPLTGMWNAVVRGDELPGGEFSFTIELKLGDKNELTGLIDSPRGEFEIVDGSFKPDSKKLYIYCENDELFLDFEGRLEGDQIKGNLSVNDAFNADFEATLAETKKSAQDSKLKVQDQGSVEDDKPGQNKPVQDPSSGRGFLGVVLSRNLTVERVIAESPAAKAGLLTGDVIQSIAGIDVANAGEVIQHLRTRRAGQKVEIVASRDGNRKTFNVELAEVPQDNSEGRDRPPMDDDEKQLAEKESDEPAIVDDVVSGTWKGTIESPRGDSELTIVLKRKNEKEITGSYETPRSDGEFTESTYDEKTGDLNLVADSGQFTLEFIGRLENNNYEGDVEFNGGNFSMAFSAKRVSTGGDAGESETVAEEIKKKTGKSLAELMPGPRWVSSLHASRFKAERCYVSFDGHRSDDDEAHLFVTNDFGESWESIRGNLPDSSGSVRVLREDIKNENVLYLGCEFGGWVSIDRGKTWTRIKKMPTVAIHEFAQHPKLDDILAATHGRSLWIADVSLLRQIKPDSIRKERKLFTPRDVIAWKTSQRRGSSGTRKFVGQNPSNSARIAYSLGSNARSVDLTIQDLKGQVLKRFDDASASKGLHTYDWDLRQASAGRNRGRFGARTGPGEYLVNLRVNGELLQTTFRVVADPDRPSDTVVTDEELLWWLEYTGEIDNL